MDHIEVIFKWKVSYIKDLPIFVFQDCIQIQSGKIDEHNSNNFTQTNSCQTQKIKTLAIKTELKSHLKIFREINWSHFCGIFLAHQNWFLCEFESRSKLKYVVFKDFLREIVTSHNFPNKENWFYEFFSFLVKCSRSSGVFLTSDWTSIHKVSFLWNTN